MADILVGCAVVLILAILGFYAVLTLRRWLKSKEGDDDTGGPAGFTLADLRELVRKGQMSSEEYERAHAQVVASVQLAAQRQAEAAAKAAANGKSVPSSRLGQGQSHPDLARDRNRQRPAP